MRLDFQCLEMRGISKSFPGVHACYQLDLELRRGEILALLGENGAGKTTFMRILSGLYQPEAGQIYLNGQAIAITSPKIAGDLGIGMVHQHFMLVPELTVTENIALGLYRNHFIQLDLPAVRQKIMATTQQYGLSIEPKAIIKQLSLGEQQKVEIIKALILGAKVLILDEPTAALTPHEIQELLHLMQTLAQAGCAIIFISHKLSEVRQVSTKVQVLHQGRTVFTGLPTNLTAQNLAQYLTGHYLPVQSIQVKPTPSKSLVPCLQVQDLWAKNDQNKICVQNVSLELQAGEILGLTGVAGSGQLELAEMINGLRPSLKGDIVLNGHKITNCEPHHIMQLGLRYIPEDRKHEGSIGLFSVSENLILKDFMKPQFAIWGWLKTQPITDFAQKLQTEFQIKTPDLQTPCHMLSGGNIQKIIIARELSQKPVVLVAAYPTRGLDLGAANYVQAQLKAISQQGTAILLISEDLDELNLCHRIVVMQAGKIIKTLSSALALD